MNKIEQISIDKSTLMDDLLPMALIRQTGEIEFVNPNFEQSLGFEVGSLENTNISKWIENPEKTILTKSSASKIKDRSPWKTIIIFKTSKDTKTKSWVRILPTTAKGEDDVFFLLIPESFNHEETRGKRLLKDKKILEEVNRNLNEGIYRSTEAGKIIYANNALLQIFGYPSIEEIKKIHLSEVYVDPSKREQVLKKLENEGAVTNEEVLLKRKDGAIFWGLLGTTRSVEDDGQVIYDGVVRDITAFKNLENQLREEKRKAEDAARDKEQFLSMMSHELRTPMNAVIGITELLLRDKPEEHQKENLKALQFSSESLLHLINDILDYSKIDAGMVEIENIPFNLIELIERIYETFKIQAKSKSLGYKLEIGDALPKRVKGDPTRISQIVNNLLSNAFKFTFDGEVCIRVHPAETAGPDIKVIIEVSDTGIGIDPSKIGSIFEKFTQATSSTTREFGGTGLGLSITKKLIELIGGTITVRSKLSKGSTFRCEVFFEEDDTTHAVKETISEHVDFRGLNVLVAEDNKINLVVLDKYLSMWNAKVFMAENGKEAIEIFNENSIDLVLMDLQMPEVDGYTAARKIIKNCADQGRSPVPIIAVTASGVAEVKQKIERSGMVDYVRKPFSPAELQEKISQYITQPDLD